MEHFSGSVNNVIILYHCKTKPIVSIFTERQYVRWKSNDNYI